MNDERDRIERARLQAWDFLESGKYASANYAYQFLLKLEPSNSKAKQLLLVASDLASFLSDLKNLDRIDTEEIQRRLKILQEVASKWADLAFTSPFQSLVQSYQEKQQEALLTSTGVASLLPSGNKATAILPVSLPSDVYARPSISLSTLVASRKWWKKESACPTLLIIIYLVLAFTTFVVWQTSERYSVTGDEPHYLVMASGIIRHGTLEQTVPYKEEFQNREIYKRGLAPTDTLPGNIDTTVIGPHGIYNVHNIGLPLLLALPFGIGGVIGAKVFMILLNSLIVLVIWKVSGLFSGDWKIRFAAVFAVSIGLPLIPASNQIYPNMLAGLICLNALYWILTLSKHRPVAIEVFYALTIGFLPWLHIVFVPPALLLSATLVYLLLIGTKHFRRVIVVVLSLLLSLGILALYNDYAFGNLFGPYENGELQVSETALMVLLGLHFDQNQGFLLQNPVFLIGVLSIGSFLANNRRLGFIVALVYLSLIVPFSLHVNWYGGYSFFGRFAWAAAVFFMIPTVFGLIKLASLSRLAFRLIIGAGILLQVLLYFRYTLPGFVLMNKPPPTWLNDYAVFYYPLQKWLPALYNVNWAYQYLPNLVFFLIIVGLLILGLATFCKPNNRQIILTVFLSTSIVSVLICGFFSNPVYNSRIFNAKDLGSQTGSLQDGMRFAVEVIDKPGYVTYGPYVILRGGSYRAVFYFASNASEDQTVGAWDIYQGSTDAIIKQGPLSGTKGQIKQISVPFDVANWQITRWQFRTKWNGSNDIKIIKIELQQL
ncbi:hypothetical protein ACFLV4_02005 [Chloroflexota bacterium]